LSRRSIAVEGYNLIMSRWVFALLVFGLLALPAGAQDQPKQAPKPPAQQPQQPQEQEPPEEDANLKPKVYAFNPLQANKELQVGARILQEAQLQGGRRAFSRGHQMEPQPGGSLAAAGRGPVYIETFGCQMNAHDSEKSSARCWPGLQPGRYAGSGRPGASTTPAASATRPSRRSSTACRISSARRARARSSACWDAWRSRKARRSSSARRTSAWWPGRPATPSCRRCWCSSKPATAASPASASIPTKPSIRRSRAATIRIAPTSPSSKAATNPAPIAWCPSRAGRSAAAPAKA
jgi:hypothetical protein